MFGQLVVAHRQRRGFTQEELAERSGLSVRAIRDLESGRVRLPRLSSVRLLADALGLSDVDRERFVQRGGGAQTVDLPRMLTSFVGRDDELVEIAGLVRDNRLVTVTGVGGVGKSRLVAAVAGEVAGGFPHGVWLVELAAFTQPELVASAVATVLGVREQPNLSMVEVLIEYLRARSVLLVLDNCEHLVAEVADVADRVLRRCAGVHVLASGRERLGVAGEVVRGISGLGVPAPEAAEVATIGTADAVRLLVDRTVALEPRFTLSEANAAAVARICRDLDGLPLAIELAAASVHALGAEQVAARLGDRFGLLTRGDRTASRRHRTLGAVIDWSYLLLSDAERLMFDQLSVFAGGFTLSAVEAVCALEDSTVDNPAVVLAQLVDKSLVVVDDPGVAVPRCRMLQSLRSYGEIRLTGRGTTAAARSRHAAYVLALFQQAPQDAGRQDWFGQMEIEHGNIRAALRWSIETGDAVTAIGLVNAVYPLWEQHGHYQEGRHWLRLALAMNAPVPARARIQALDCAAALAVFQGDIAEAGTASVEAAALSRQIGDMAGVARALITAGLAAIFSGDNDEVESTLEKALATARLAGDRYLEGNALIFLTFAALAQDEHQRALRLSEQGVAVMGIVDDTEGIARATVLQAEAVRRLGQPAAAATLLRRSLRDFQRLNHMKGLSIGLHIAVLLVSELGDHRQAVSLLGAADALRDSAGVVWPPVVEVWTEAAMVNARKELDPVAFDRAWHTHRAAPPETVVAAAIRAFAPITEPKDPGSGS